MSPTDRDEVERIPIIAETVRVDRREIDRERVSVRTHTREDAVTVRESVRREAIEVRRVAVDREVEAVPPIREEGDVTIVPVVEERLVVEKRLFLVEEVHLLRTVRAETVELPTTLRRTEVDVVRDELSDQQRNS